MGLGLQTESGGGGDFADIIKYDARAESYAVTELQGKLIAIRNAGKTEGKRHVNFEVVELEAPTVEKL